MNKKTHCFVASISLDLKDKLKEDLLSQGFTLSTPAYTLFSAKKKGVSCTLYTSGKLTVQGKEMDEFIQFYLEPEILKSLLHSHPEIDIDMSPHIGIDESGKGDFFGPLCIAGTFADQTQIQQLLSLGVKDSKMVSDAGIKKLSIEIKKICPHVLVFIAPKKYNELYKNFHNLNRLLAWGHATAIAELVEKTGCTTATIDQFAAEEVVEKALAQKKISISLTQRHRGESDPVVAAASILARASFLQGLDALSDQYLLKIPKGASSLVIEIGRQLVAKYGPSVLENVAKLHFKTTAECLKP